MTFMMGFIAGGLLVGGAVLLGVTLPLRRTLTRERQSGYWPKAQPVGEQSGLYATRSDLREEPPAPPVPQAPPVQGFVDHRRVVPRRRTGSGRE